VDKARAREGPAYSHLRKEKCTISLWKLDKRNGRKAKPKSSSKRAGVKSKPKRSTKARTSSKSSSSARSKLKRAAKKVATAAVLAAGASALRTAVDELSPNQKEMEGVRSQTNRTEAMKAKSKR
jgi:hypothetical protein